MKNLNKKVNKIDNAIKYIFKSYPILKDIILEIKKSSGKVYLVGGAVRDIILDLEITDLDIEVHYLELQQLANILSKFGIVNYVGKSFGVLKLENLPFDWSLPRTDTAGRKPEVKIDPSMGIVEALRRRDLTMNAMAIDLVNFELNDPFHGQADIENKIIRSPDIKFFTEDPLRFYRVMQFVSRFEMNPDNSLNKVCKTMDISKVSIERIEAEFEKMLLKSKRASLGLRWINSISRLKEILPELAATIKIKQDPEWHPEGYVFEHLMQTLDATCTFSYDSKNEHLIISYAGLCHDLGKATKTQIIKKRIHNYGHAEASAKLAKSMLKRITNKKDIIKSVCLLVKYHMSPLQFGTLNSTLSAYRRLALKLQNYASLEMLGKLALADQRGRNPDSHLPLNKDVKFIDDFIQKAKEAEVYHTAEKSILLGRDIIDIVQPGPEMGKLLKYAYNLQIKKGIKDKEILKKFVLKKIKNS